MASKMLTIMNDIKGVLLSSNLISEVDKGDNQPETGGWQENEVEYVFHLHLSHFAFPALLSKAMAYLKHLLHGTIFSSSQ